jgi:competence protein ComEC
MKADQEEIKNGGGKPKKIIKFAILGLIFANLFVWLAVFGNEQQKMLEVWFFDVGQGDAAFAQLPSGAQIIIDGGPNDSVVAKLGKVMPFYDRDIDWMVLSHPERDHVDGLLAVLKNYRVHNIIWSGIPKDTAESKEWTDLVAKEGANVVIARPGEKFALGGDPDCVLEILAPDTSDAGNLSSGRSSNDLSVVARLEYGQRSFLFTGDATDKEEEFSWAADPEPVDVLKVAHHGSKTSADDIFMADLLPAAAVISVGAGNSYGHPNQETLEMLGKYDIKTLRTDQGGDILFRTDGEHIFLSTEK